jgi:Transposase DDE domain group 1
MNGSRVVERVRVTVGDRSTASLVGAHLLGEIADRTGLASGYSAAVPWTGERAPGHDRGRLLAQVAVMLAAGGRCVADMAALRDQPDLFGTVASGPTIWRAVHQVDADVLAGLRAARAGARARAWAAGGAPAGIVLDVDATLIDIHSEQKEGAASNYKRGFGFHPMLCFLDATGEALAGILRPGNAAANSGADQLAVVDLAIAQLPAAARAGHRPGDPADAVNEAVLVRADTAGAVKAFVEGLVARNCEFSIGARVSDGLDAAIARVPPDAWVPALNTDGQRRHRAEVAELDVSMPGWWPAGTRAICRRETPHPGAQLRLWDHDGMRHQVVLTNSSGDFVALETRHRRHAQVENRIRNLKDCGLERMPFASFTANAAWLELVLTAADLLAWCQQICLHGDLARAEPRTLRYRLLHTAGRVVHGARRVTLRLPDHWPWTADLAHAYHRLALLNT